MPPPAAEARCTSRSRHRTSNVDRVSDTPDPEPRTPAVDLDTIGRDLDGVEQALRRLDDGTYWTDEITGAPIPDDVLAADPVARRSG